MIKEAEKLETKAKTLEKNIEAYLFKELGIKEIEKKETRKGLQFISFKKLFDWNNSNRGINKFNSTKYPLTSILQDETFSISIFRSKSPKYDSKGKAVILNQKCNRWNNIEIEHSKNVNDKWYSNIDNTFFTKKGDILINSTGDGTIGRATCITSKFENLLYDSHILLLRLNPQRIDPLFFSYLFNSSYGQIQVESLKSAQSTKQTELGVNNLRKFSFPYIEDIEVQRKIVNRINAAISKISVLKLEAQQKREDALNKFEETIFI